MKKISPKNGYTLVQAIFVIVVLSMLGAAMVKMFRVQTQTTSLSHQGIRAYYAAKSALEWGKNKTIHNSTCFPSYIGSDFFDDDLNFTITLNCTSNTYTEGNNIYTWYRLNSKAEYGEFEDLDYVCRKLTVQVINATEDEVE